MLALYPSVLMHRGFLANLGILTTTFVGLFAWVSGAPIVMQGATYGLTPWCSASLSPWAPPATCR